MNTLYPILYAELSREGISCADLAKILHIPEKTVFHKLRGDSPWEFTEAVQICCLLRTSDIRGLFVQLDSKTC